MATPLDMTQATADLKTRFADPAMKYLGYMDYPLFADIRKDTNAFGESMKLPVQVGRAQGRSKTFATAQRNIFSMNLKAFDITPNTYYAVSQVEGQVVESVKGNLNAFVDLVTLSLKDLLLSHTGDLAGQMYRDGSGGIGTIADTSFAAGGLGAGIIQLVDPDDITQFDVGLVLQARTGTAAVETALAYVTRVDRANGRITVATSGQGGAAADPALWAAGDFLLLEGNADATLKGLDAWLPDSVSTSDNFFGVNRSVDRTRLAGVFYDGRGMTIKQALINGTNLISREGGKPKKAYCSYDTFAAAVVELNQQVQLTNPTASTKGVVPFPGVDILTTRGPITLVPDASCQSGVIYVLEPSSWTLSCAGPGVPFIDDFGQDKWMRMSNEDAYELRTKSYAQLSCNAPGHNGKILVTVR